MLASETLATASSTQLAGDFEERRDVVRRFIAVAVLGTLLLVTSAGVAAAQQTATAQLEDTDGNPVGNAEFVEGPGGVTITINLQPGQNALGPGEHGVHIHEKGSISPDFEAAGEHFNPTHAEHGFQNPNGPHAGDLENITVLEDGSATYQTTSDRITLSRGERSILDSDGSALVIHRGADDYRTDPSGSSGGRAVAGVIRESATGESTTPSRESTTGKEKLPSSGGVSVLPLAVIAGVAGLAAGIFLWRGPFNV